MIYSLFIDDFSKSLEKYKYDKRFIKYLLLNFLHDNDNVTYDKVFDYLNDYYGKIIERQKLYDYLCENFDTQGDVFSLTEIQIDEYNRLNRIEHIFYLLENKGESYIFNELFSKLNLVNNDLNYLLAIIYSLVNNELQLQDDYVFMICFDAISNQNSYLRKIDYLMYNDEDMLDVKIANYLLSNLSLPK